MMLRLFGYSLSKDVEIAHIDCGKELWRRDSLLGFSLNSGRLDCSINGLGFRLTQLPNGSRVTSVDFDCDDCKKIHLYGCSVTWGHGLNDEQTEPWKLQEKLKCYKVYNWGVGASGTVQVWLSLQDQIKKGNIPSVVIYNYASFHEERNTFSWSWRRTWQNILRKGYNRDIHQDFYIPVIRSKEMTVRYVSEDWVNFNLPLVRYSVLSNVVNELIQSLRDVDVSSSRITENIIEEINRLCSEHQIQFIVMGLTADEKTKELFYKLRKRGIHIGDISVDYRQTEYNLMPYDGHPNERANEVYMEKTLAILLDKSLVRL